LCKPLDEFSGIGIQPSGDFEQINERHVDFSALNVPNVSAMKTGSLTKILLAQFQAKAKISHAGSKFDQLVLGSAVHGCKWTTNAPVASTADA
jgi:hypothetical protein